METQKNILEHPFVTRVKAMLNPPLSPALKIKDILQPSYGNLAQHRSFTSYASNLAKYAIE